VNNKILFFNIRDGPYFPTLRVLHQCTRARRAQAGPHDPRSASPAL
jgi:predicted ribosome-associated RNA-binding protein Tma20